MGHGQHRSSGAGPANFVSNIKQRIASNISPTHQTQESFESIDQDYPPSFSTKRSSTSSRSSPTSPSTGSVSHTPDSKPVPPRRHIPTQSLSFSSQKTKSITSIVPPVPTSSTYADLNHSASSLTMASISFTNGIRPEYGKPPSTSLSNVSFGQGATNVPLPASSLPPAPGSSQNPSIVYQQIHDVSSKRISTLDYLRKAHDGRVYWFNTLLFKKSDISKMSFFEPKKLARRATNYLLLGLSIPTTLDANASNPQEYLRALNTLLAEFESYQQTHPPEGGSSSSYSRARFPQFLKRATHTSSKGRRTSSATDIGLPINSSDPADLKTTNNGTTASSTVSYFPASELDLLPGEEYTYLLTPSLPFDPDFFETFATLCDVLIDCYTRIMGLIPSPAICIPGTGEIFAKADAKLRKVIVTGIIKEFEDASKAGAKAEFAGLGKVVLGGLM